MNQKKLLCFSGSGAIRSRNGRLCEIVSIICESFYKNITVNYLNLKHYSVPIYDADVEELYGIPDNIASFFKVVDHHDFLFIASPEYNSSVTPLLKNTLDWLSRYKRFIEKPVTIASISYTNEKQNKSLIHLEDILNSLRMRVMKNKFHMHVIEFDLYEKYDLKTIRDSDLYNRIIKILNEIVENKICD